MKMIHWNLSPTTILRTLLSGNEINKAKLTKYETYTKTHIQSTLRKKTTKQKKNVASFCEFV